MDAQKMEQINSAINEQLLYNQLFNGKISMDEYLKFLELSKKTELQN